MAEDLWWLLQGWDMAVLVEGDPERPRPTDLLFLPSLYIHSLVAQPRDVPVSPLDCRRLDMRSVRGLPARLGLDYASLKDLNPAIVCAHLSAYGRDNARAKWPGYDYLMQVVARDIDSYQRLMDALLEKKAAMARYFTYIVTKEVKAPTGLPPGLLSGLAE